MDAKILPLINDILLLPASDIIASYRSKKLSPVDVALACLEQADRYQKEFNAFTELPDRAHVLQSAAAAGQRWKNNTELSPLDGIPVTVKDWYNIKGMPTRFGSLLSSPEPQKDDAILVSRLKKAGAIILGKTTLPEYGHKGTTFSPLTGITRNPWNPELTPGGSSGGAAAAAAAGMGYLHVGSDAGGSIRIPASFSGVFGFKPTPGSVPHSPPGPFSSMSSAGPLTRNVRDAALLLDVISTTHFSDALNQAMPPLKIAYAATINDTPVTDAIGDAVEKAAAMCRTFGTVDVVQFSIPNIIDVFNKHWMAVAAWATQGYSVADIAKTDPRYWSWATRGNALSLPDYIEAQQQRLLIAEEMKNLMAQYDILITPTTAMTAFAADQNMPVGPDGALWEDWTPLTYPANLARLPAASLPCGLDENGMPIGLQVMAAEGRDHLVLQFCHALEREIGFKDWLSRQS